MLTLYRLLLGLLSPLILILLFQQGRSRHGGWRFLRERLGLVGGTGPSCPIWIHAASVGEVRAGLPLMRLASAVHGTLVTTNTPEGARLVAAELGSAVRHCYCPVDFAWAVRRLIDRYEPRQLFVMETELWPNLYRVAEGRGLSIAIVNGRLSEKTLGAPRFLRDLYRDALDSVRDVWARSEADARGFRALGCDGKKIQVLGNIKYAGTLEPADLQAPEDVAGRRYVLAASTHDDEELQLAGVWGQLPSAPLLVLLPRHPTRGEAIVGALDAHGLSVARRSRGERPTKQTQVYVADTVGELTAFAAGASWVFMGGSLVDVGGHNLLEPAALGKAIVTGKHLSNFRDEAEYLASREALLTVEDVDEFRRVAERLLGDPGEVALLGRNAEEAARAKAAGVYDRYRATFRARIAVLSDAAA